MANVTTIVGSIQGIKPTEKNLKLNGKLSKFLIGADVIKNKNYKEVEYLVDKLIPRGTLCALVGESDTGKSSLLRQLAVSMVYGDEDFLGFKMKSSCNNVLYVSTEDGEMATSVWLNKYFGQEKSKDDILSRLNFIFSTDGIISNLRDSVKKNCIDLIIVDSYADLFTGSMNNSNEVRSFLNQYDSLVNEFGTTVIFLHHTKKSSAGSRPNKNNILGSQGFEAKMRSVMMLTKDNDNKSHRHLCVVKNNYMPETNKSESFVLKFNEQLAFENTGERVDLDELIDEDYLKQAKELREGGKSIRAITDELNSNGFNVSKSSIQRKLE
jgi:RecA-family ATPase